MTTAVEFKGISKSFHGCVANSNINLRVAKGSIHAIVGENGAGKSTAMKILYGNHQPDSGSIWIDGKLWGGKNKPWSSPSDAIHAGIGMVHQHFMLGDPYSVLDNIILGSERSDRKWKWLPKPLRPIDRAAALEKLDQISKQYGLAVDWNAKVEDLSVGLHQRIEILKLLYHEANILILDEPTAVLTPQETTDLFENLRKLTRQGKTIIIITHKLKEVMSLADRVTVFRHGTVVGEREIQKTDTEDLAALMVGRKVTLKVETPPPPRLGKAVLEVENLNWKGAHRRLQDLNFKIHRGEIVGIAGVEGNGQAELIQVLLHPKDYPTQLRGNIRILGQDIRSMTTETIKKLGVAVVPDDRLRDGLLVHRPVLENFLLGIQRREKFSKKGVISTRALLDDTWNAIKEYDIRPKSVEIEAGAMSGGNQQKLVIARELNFNPSFFIAAQPTRGVDVGAIEFIHKRIIRARNDGNGVLLISSELDEVLALSDRILVMFEGRFIAEFSRESVNEKVLGLRMGGADHHV